MSAVRIEFSQVFGAEGEFPLPYPATKEIPEWYKQMPLEGEFRGTQTLSLKHCPPFLEAMACGYIIPLAAEIRLTLDPGGALQAQSTHDGILHLHMPSQYQGTPFENFPLLKFINPWLVRTPPGYSTLFVSPLNRSQLPVHPLSGLVETDTFYREVNFPAVLTLRPGTSLTLPRGLPLMQIIPVQREEFQAVFAPLDREKRNAMEKQATEGFHFYKDNFWQKKDYK